MAREGAKPSQDPTHHELSAGDVSLSEDSIRLRVPSEVSHAPSGPIALELVDDEDEEEVDEDDRQLVLDPSLADFGEIARGGMGSIRKVFDKNVLRFQVLKVPSTELNHHPLAMARFLEEAQITGQLEHPNILPVYNVAMRDATRARYFTMKLARGQTFTQVLDSVPVERRNGRELEKLLRILLKVSDGVSFAHSRGVVHRDLKPDNIMVGSHGQVYVMDWGCARLLGIERPSGGDQDQQQHPEETVTSSRGGDDELGTIIGTVAYMAPEQAFGVIHEIDGRSDIYALGAILYRMLTDVPPHRALTPRAALLHAQSGEVVPPQEKQPNVKLPPELCRIALKAMAKARDDRYQKVEDFAADIERFLRQGAWFATKVYAKGTVVIREGDAADSAFIILRGSASAYKTDKGKELPLRTMKAGDVFGEAAILNAQPRTASVVALEELELMIITRESLELELAADSWVGSLVRTLARRFRDLDNQYSELRSHVEGFSLPPPVPHDAVRTWVNAHFAYEGSPRAGGGVVASYSSMIRKLNEQNISEDLVLALVETTPELSIERERDTIIRST